MRIAIVVWELDVRGGTQRQALELAVNLQDMGHEIVVYCNTFDRKKCYEDLCKNLKICCASKKTNTQQKKNSVLNYLTFPLRILDFIFYDSSIREIKNRIEADSLEKKFDIINIHDYEVWKIAPYLTSHKIIWMMNDIAGVPSIYEKNKTKNIFKNIFWKTILIVTKNKIKRINKIVVLDKRNMNFCKKYYNRDPVIVRSGIDPDLFRDIMIHKDDRHIEIFASGIFLPYRRFEDLILATKILIEKKINNFHVTINGLNSKCYEYFLFIKNTIDDNGLQDTITLVNGMSEKELLQNYAKANVFVFPNHEQTWGLSVFEAMLAECICIVSKSSGAHEVLTDYENAILLTPKSPVELAKILEDILTNYSTFLYLGKNGSNFVKNNLSWKTYTNSMLKIFEND
jgi:glycosyltransferase involved in cell wall biosynthesis